MGTTRQSKLPLFALVLTGLLVALPLAAKPFTVELAGNAVVFTAATPGAGTVELRVTGADGFMHQETFERGGTVTFRLVDQWGDALPDGLYNYEISANPALRVRGVDEELPTTYKAGEKLAGTFRISGGSLVDPDTPETLPTKDIVHNDDVIITGSLCVGFDCVNGESFGFDTIRIKENNLRIKAQDTSNSASFPTNDWQLTFNDSSNGGAEKFSIDDIDGGRTPFTIEAGAPSHSLYVDDGGRVGFGTSTPVVDLHVVSGNTPTLRLQQDGSSGFTPQTWDVAGNETNFFIRDATNGSTLPFRIFPGAPSNSIFVAASTGNVGLGTTSPDFNLDIEDNSTGFGFRLTNTGTAGGSWDFFMNGNTGRLNIRDNSGGTTPFKIDQGAAENLLQLGVGASNRVTINGNLMISSSGVCTDSDGGDGGVDGCDGVFQSEYPLESLEEHAAFMWDNSHLPGVGPTSEDAPWNLVRKTAGILNELEKAHIYIEQLHKRLEAKESQLSTVLERLDRMEQRLPANGTK